MVLGKLVSPHCHPCSGPAEGPNLGKAPPRLLAGCPAGFSGQ